MAVAQTPTTTTTVTPVLAATTVALATPATTTVVTSLTAAIAVATTVIPAVTPNLIKNLIFVRQFTTDNHCYVEFDPHGLSVNHLQTKNVTSPSSLVTDISSPTLWYRWLGYLSNQGLSCLAKLSLIPYNKYVPEITTCHACQLGRHVQFPFATSTFRTNKVFDLIHCDLWTSPINGASRYKYYLVILDDFAHYLWIFFFTF